MDQMDLMDEMDHWEASPCRPYRPYRPFRAQPTGLTLVELLVVVIILTTLVAAALPVMAPSSETRRLREASRSLNTMITTAQSKATELGRPYGIWLQKQSIQTGRAEDRGAVLTVFYCEEPPAFGGYDDKSAVILRSTGRRTPNWFIAVFGRYEPLQSPQFVPQPLPPSIFRPDDRVLLEEKEFRILPPQQSLYTVDANGYLETTDRFLVEYVGTPGPFLYVSYSPGQGSGLSGDQWTFPQPYLIRRQPQKIDDPLQLPAGIAIDLEASGDRSTFYHDPLRPAPNSNDTPVAILFSPGGALRSAYRNQGGDGSTSFGAQQFFNDPGDGAVYLMVAKREQVGESQLDVTKTSWLDPESLWVTISPQTGRVTSDVNSVDSFDAVAIGSQYQELVARRLASRAIAKRSQNMGGR